MASGRRAGHPTQRPRVTCGTEGCAVWSTQDPTGQPQCGTGQRHHFAGGVADPVHRLLSQHLERATGRARRRGGFGPVDHRFPGTAVQQPEYLHTADAIADTVVGLEDVTGSPALQAFDQGSLPQRARSIERAHRHGLCFRDELRHGARPGQPNAVHVVGEVHLRIGHPRGAAQSERRLHHPLAETRHDA